ncbi:PspC domain-containing protein [Knoellia locipacati]|uniref:PspC domain-containing protein n=1 Tax=Knoellia locipacati TaxID=882824 RepID=UPI00384C66BA
MTQTPHQAQTGAGPQDRPQGNKFWDDILSTGLRRDRSRQWFAGVCSGIARRVDVDPVLIRAAFIALTLFGGFGIVAYLVAWLLMPDESGRIMARDALNRDGGGDASGAIILSVIAVLVIAAIVFGDNGFLIGWGVIPIAIVGWLFWRHEQGRQSGSNWTSAAAPTAPPPPAGVAPSAGPYAAGPQTPNPYVTSPYAASSPAAAAAPTAEAAAGGAPARVTGAMAPPDAPGWQPPPAPPVPPRAHLPLAPPPPPRPRRRTAGFAGFALVLGLAAVGYGAGLMLDGPVGFPGSEELLGGVLALGAASLATLVIGLTGRRSLLSAALVTVLGLGVGGAGIVESSWEGDRGIRIWTPAAATTTQHFDHSVGRTTVDLRPLFASLAAPTPSAGPGPTPPPGLPVAPQDLDIEQGAGEMTIIVPAGVDARIRASVEFGEVRVVGNLPEGISDRDDGGNDGPGETLSLDLGTGNPTVIVRADITVGQITIQEG